jgi:hypothetical protein
MAAISSSHPQHRHHQPTAAVLAPHHHRQLELPTSFRLPLSCNNGCSWPGQGAQTLQQQSKYFNSDNIKPFSSTGFEQFNSRSNHSSSQSSNSISNQYTTTPSSTTTPTTNDCQRLTLSRASVENFFPLPCASLTKTNSYQWTSKKVCLKRWKCFD